MFLKTILFFLPKAGKPCTWNYCRELEINKARGICAVDGLRSYQTDWMWPIAKITLSSSSLAPAQLKVCRYWYGSKKARSSSQRNQLSYWLPRAVPPPGVCRGTGRFEPQCRGQAYGASLMSMVTSPLTYWEQKQMWTQPISQAASESKTESGLPEDGREEREGRLRWNVSLCAHGNYSNSSILKSLRISSAVSAF